MSISHWDFINIWLKKLTSRQFLHKFREGNPVGGRGSIVGKWEGFVETVHFEFAVEESLSDGGW